MQTFRSAIVAIVSIFLLAGCSESKGRFVEVERGGFLFDYQLAEVKAGFIAKTLKPLPQGATLEASFEDPTGGPALVVRQPASGVTEYNFVSPPIKGLVKDKDYGVILRVRDAQGNEVQRIEMAFASDTNGLPAANSAVPAIPPPTVAFPPQNQTSGE
jgi:hypothetical protein